MKLRILLLLAVSFFTTSALADWTPGPVPAAKARMFYAELMRPVDVQRKMLMASVEEMIVDGYRTDLTFEPILASANPDPDKEPLKMSTIEKTDKTHIYRMSMHFVERIHRETFQVIVEFQGIDHGKAVGPHPIILGIKIVNTHPFLFMGGMSGGTRFDPAEFIQQWTGEGLQQQLTTEETPLLKGTFSDSSNMWSNEELKVKCIEAGY